MWAVNLTESTESLDVQKKGIHTDLLSMKECSTNRRTTRSRDDDQQESNRRRWQDKHGVRYLQKGGEPTTMTNTPGKPQNEASPKNRTQKVGVMSTTNVTPKPPGDGKSTQKRQQHNTSAHIGLVLQEAAAKLTRRLNEDEMANIWDAATKLDHEMTADEALAVLEIGVEEFTETVQREVMPKADEVIKDVSGLLARDLTSQEELQISDSLAGAEPLTKSEYENYVSETAGHFRNLEHEEVAQAQALADAANPPVERWTKEATELGTNLGVRIGTFKAMEPQIEQVRVNFIALKDAIDAGKLPKTTRIMANYSWKKTKKDGKTTTNEKGFRDFQDYCRVILKRGKSAVYTMLKDAKMPREKKAPDNSFGALVKRGARSFIGLHEELEDQTIGFDSFMESITNAARAMLAAEQVANRKAADEPVAATTAKVGNETMKGEVLPPSQGQAG
jgi:hypothetical protein